MSPALVSSAPVELNHWWKQLRFRQKNKKGWSEILDETFLLQTNLIDDVPLFYAAKKNSVGCINNLLRYASTNIFERGGLGETALHIAVMNDNLEAAVALMDGAPELINEPMTSELFQGLTPLHIAVINQNISLVQHLISRGADVSTPRATGLYFKKRIRGLIYYGEHILSFAACTGNKKIISMLLIAGASTRSQDYQGNTVLHILILQPNQETACQTIDLIMAHDQETDHSVPLDMVPNLRGLTPFKLAAKRGNVVVFQHLVNKRRVFQGSLGPWTSNLYDLTEIDSWADNKSVLEVVVSSRHSEARRILEVTPVRELVSLKWNLYGKHYFRFLLFVYLLYISIFTACCMFRPLKPIPANYSKPDNDKTIYIQKRLNESYVTYGDHVRMGGEIISVVGAVAMLLLEIPDILRVGAKRYFGQTALGGPFHVILIIYGCLVVLLCVFRLCEVQDELTPMAACLVLGWCNVMFFARGFEMLGPLVIVVQKMLFGDMLKFACLMMVVLMGFATAAWMFDMTQDPTGLPDYSTYPITIFTEFEVDVLFINLPVDETILSPPIAYIVNVSYNVVGAFFMLNLLATMMGDTQEKVDRAKDEFWRTQVVATILMLERRLPRRLVPRLGIHGLGYGLKDCWYLRADNRNDEAVEKMRQYIKASKDCGGKKQELEKRLASGVPVTGSKKSSRFNKDTLTGWDMIHQNLFDCYRADCLIK
uniref:Transient receptor potential cation channel, subfamily V, member 6 n=1 Tax=Anabas testudineus TaxID=64144 RepID=A0A3Q1ILU7_ANATE